LKLQLGPRFILEKNLFFKFQTNQKCLADMAEARRPERLSRFVATFQFSNLSSLPTEKKRKTRASKKCK